MLFRSEMIDLFTMSKNYGIIYKMVKESKKIKKKFKYIPIKKKKQGVIQFPKENDFEIRIGDGDRSDNCKMCGTPVEDYLYAEDFGKVCLDCYMKIYQ